MKIAFINKYQYKVNRGAETFIKELSQRLSKNHEVKIFTEIKPLELLKFDLVIPTNGRVQAFLTRIVTWLGKRKMIVSAQSGIGLDDRLNLYSFPDYFIPLSQKAFQWAKKINPFVKMSIIPNGVDLQKFRPGTKSRKKIVLSVGAFTAEKRHDLTIKAVAKLEEVKLIIVGSGGSNKEKIEKLGKSLLKDRFEIQSVIPEQMPKIYREASVFVYPTVAWESFGIAMLEAMASGLPVVANNDPIRREIVGNSGFFINPNDLNSYSEAIARALQRNWGKLPRDQASKFSWDIISEKYEKIINSL